MLILFSPRTGDTAKAEVGKFPQGSDPDFFETGAGWNPKEKSTKGQVDQYKAFIRKTYGRLQCFCYGQLQKRDDLPS
jgi:hypothetical protein